MQQKKSASDDIRMKKRDQSRRLPTKNKDFAAVIFFHVGDILASHKRNLTIAPRLAFAFALASHSDRGAKPIDHL